MVQSQAVAAAHPQPESRFFISDEMKSPPADSIPMSPVAPAFSSPVAPAFDSPAASQVTPGQPHPEDPIAKEMLEAFDAAEQ